MLNGCFSVCIFYPPIFRSQMREKIKTEKFSPERFQWNAVRNRVNRGSLFLKDLSEGCISSFLCALLCSCEKCLQPLTYFFLPFFTHTTLSYLKVYIYLPPIACMKNCKSLQCVYFSFMHLFVHKKLKDFKVR